MRETQVWSLGWEDPLEKEMATHSSTLGWKIPWTGERGLQSMGSQSQTRLSDFTFTFKGTDNIYSYLQCIRQPTPRSVLKICLLPCMKRLTIIKFSFLWLLMKKVSLKRPMANVHVLLMLVLDLGFLPCMPPEILLLSSLLTLQGCQHSQNSSFSLCSMTELP